MLSIEDRNKINSILEAKKIRVEGEIHVVEKLLSSNPSSFISKIAQADAAKFIKDSEASLKTMKVELLRIEYALSLVFKENFGTCIRCNNIIPFSRLLFEPENTKCQNCTK